VLLTREPDFVAGHGRIEAAEAARMEEVPTIRLDQLTRDQIRSLRDADNKLAENAGWDTEILAI